MGSLRSFQSAVRFGESAETYANLGVCLMRLGTATPKSAWEEKVTWYHKAHAAMTTAKTLAVSDKEWEHVSENNKALKQSMNAEGIEAPLKALDPLEPPPVAAAAPRRPPGGSFSSGARPEKRKNEVKRRAPPAPTVYRERLLHQRNVPLAPPFPHVSVEDLEGNDPRFDVYREVGVRTLGNTRENVCL
jgi:hypothetical protein